MHHLKFQPIKEVYLIYYYQQRMYQEFHKKHFVEFELE